MNESTNFDDMLSNELLVNEKVRMSFIAGIAFLILIILLVIATLDWPGKTLLKSYEPIFYVVGILIILIIRELAIIKFVLANIAKNKRKINILKYVNLVFEISVPTVLIIIFLTYYNNIFVLNSPAVSLYFLVIILTILNLEFRISVLAGIIASFEYLVVVYFALQNYTSGTNISPLTHFTFYVGRALALLISGGLAGYIGYQLRQKIIKSYQTLEEKNKIRKIFGQQISNEIVNELLLKKNKIETEKKFVSIMFVDIRGFTPFAETKEPEEIIKYQNQVFGFMADTIIKHNGVINQFLGDGYMASFGAPISKGNDCQNAVNAAIEILHELKRKNDTHEIPFTRIGIGLHAGFVVAGNVGSKNRQQYSISGNTVIIASRIEQLTKRYQSQLLISSELNEQLINHSEQFMLLEPVNVKGREKPIEIYKWNKEN